MKRMTVTICVSITLIMTIGLVVFLIRIPSPTQIFQEAMNHVVEVKARNNEEDISFGSAVLINNDGEFVTNAHVVIFRTMGVDREFQEYFIRFAFEDEFRGVYLTRFDVTLDLAILRLKELPPFRLRSVSVGDSRNLRSGDTVFAVGNSQNFGVGISQGIVSLPLVRIEYSGTMREVIQSDITITTGNSGGALLDRRGRLVGITTFRIRDSSGNIVFGIAYSIPVYIVLGFINR